jgi:integrase
MIDPDDLSYQVRIFNGIDVYEGKRVTTHTVRWRVGGNRFRKPHGALKQAESFRNKLIAAQNEGQAFSLSEGLPSSMLRKRRPVKGWYPFLCDYVDAKWDDISAKHRENIAFALTRAVAATLPEKAGKPDDALIRAALNNWAFSKTSRNGRPIPDEIARTLEWIEQHSLFVGDLADPKVMRTVVKAVTTRLDGTKAATSSRRRNHTILNAALDHAVQEGLLGENPIEPLEASVAKGVHQVDKRCVVNPPQAVGLLDAVRDYGRESEEHKSGPRLVAFFGSMYYCAFRPEEAINLRRENLALPPPRAVWNEAAERKDLVYDWGEVHLVRAAPDSGPRWTDSGSSRDDRPLKQREEGEIRSVPCPPEQTRLFWEHLEQFGTGDDGRLFVGVQGRPLATITYRRAWRHARRQAFTEAEHRSPLAGTPYALRHTCVSTWLNAGVSETLVARWAGHSVAVLKAIYAKCLVGEEERAKRQIEKALKRGAGSFAED